MTTRVLVTYATKYGATKEIAEKIGEVLAELGLGVDVLPVKEVKSIGAYQAVVLGSAVYVGAWRKEAKKFLLKNADALARCKVWFFSSGPTEAGDPQELLDGWTFPKGLQETSDRIKPVDVAVFGGSLDPEKLNGLERWMIQKVNASSGDFRDWENITGWALQIASELALPV